VTVLHSGSKTVTPKDRFKEIIVPVKMFGPFVYQYDVIKETRKDCYDVVISLFDVRWVSSVISIYFKNDSKFIWWGAWITKNKIIDLVRIFFTKKSDANVFYTNEAREDFIHRGVDKYNLYVANNTFDVGERIKSFESDCKDCILFVGSLDKRKQNDTALRAFKNIINKIPREINFIIIGEGDELCYLINLTNELGINNRVCFKGKINDTDELKKYYQKAIVSVSFGQAGLSVLQSLGFGVPFLTKVNAISGGEKSNIINNFSGVFCEDSQVSLEKSLINLCTDIEFAKKIGENAYNYYSRYCTIENMVQGFRDAIENTRLAEVDVN